MRERLLKKYLNAYQIALNQLSDTTQVTYADQISERRIADLAPLSYPAKALMMRQKAFQDYLEKNAIPKKYQFILDLLLEINEIKSSIKKEKFLSDFGVIKGIAETAHIIGPEQAFLQMKDELVVRLRKKDLVQDEITAKFYTKAMRVIDAIESEVYSVPMKYLQLACDNREKVESVLPRIVNVPDNAYQSQADFLKFSVKKYPVAFNYAPEVPEGPKANAKKK